MLKDQIQQDLFKAMKQANEQEVMTLRGLLASVLGKEKEKRYLLTKSQSEFDESQLEKESQLTDKEVQALIFSEVKKRKEAIVEFEKAGRKDLVDKESLQAEILGKYLPQQLSEQEIREKARVMITSLAPRKKKIRVK